MGVNDKVPSWRLATLLYPLCHDDLHPFHMQNTFSPSQGPPPSHPIIASALSLECCHLNGAWVPVNVVRCSCLCIVPWILFFSVSADLRTKRQVICPSMLNVQCLDRHRITTIDTAAQKRGKWEVHQSPQQFCNLTGKRGSALTRILPCPWPGVTPCHSASWAGGSVLWVILLLSQKLKCVCSWVFFSTSFLSEFLGSNGLFSVQSSSFWLLVRTEIIL